MDLNNNLNSNFDFHEDDLKTLCTHCFDVILNKLHRKQEKVLFPEKFNNVIYDFFKYIMIIFKYIRNLFLFL